MCKILTPQMPVRLLTVRRRKRKLCCALTRVFIIYVELKALLEVSREFSLNFFLSFFLERRKRCVL